MAKRKTIDYGDQATSGKTLTEPPPTVELVVPEERVGQGKQQIQRASQKSADVIALVRAVTEAHTPQEQQRLLRKAAEIAERRDDWFGILSVLRFEIEYGVGKPVQRSVSATVPLQQMLDAFRDDVPGEDSGTAEE